METLWHRLIRVREGVARSRGVEGAEVQSSRQLALFLFYSDCNLAIFVNQSRVFFGN